LISIEEWVKILLSGKVYGDSWVSVAAVKKGLFLMEIA